MQSKILKQVKLCLLFSSFVCAGKGYIVWSDLAKLVVTGGRNASISPRSADNQSEFIKSMDMDFSGGLSQQELWSPFLELIRSSDDINITELIEKDDSSHPSLIKYIQCLDSNGDGSVTEDEEPNFLELLDFNCESLSLV